MENQFPEQNQGPVFENRGPQLNQPVQPLYGGPNGPRPLMLAILPGSIAVLSIGVSACVSSVFYFMMGIPGIVLGIIGLRMARKSEELYNANPGAYKKGTVSMLRSGKTCSIVGLCIGCGILFTGLLLIMISLIKEAF